MSGIETHETGQAPGLHIDETACVGCGKCLRACASGGIELVGE